MPSTILPFYRSIFLPVAFLNNLDWTVFDRLLDTNCWRGSEGAQRGATPVPTNFDDHVVFCVLYTKTSVRAMIPRTSHDLMLSVNPTYLFLLVIFECTALCRGGEGEPHLAKPPV